MTAFRKLESRRGRVFPCLQLSDLSLDAVYTHDPSLPTDHGLIVLRPGKPNRIPEGQSHVDSVEAFAYRILGEMSAPGIRKPATRSGSIPALFSSATVTAPTPQDRANAPLLQPQGVEVLSAPLPYGPGPSACLHLMSLISLLDQKTALVDLSWLAVETVELLNPAGAGSLKSILRRARDARLQRAGPGRKAPCSPWKKIVPLIRNSVMPGSM